MLCSLLRDRPCTSVLFTQTPANCLGQWLGVSHTERGSSFEAAQSLRYQPDEESGQTEEEKIGLFEKSALAFDTTITDCLAVGVIAVL